MGYWPTPGELDPSEGRAYKLSFVPARGECNIASNIDPGPIWLTSLIGNHWATGGLRVNSSSVKGGLINFPLLLLEGEAILQMTPKADC